jgi:Rps23 Pro-64 3,4-dihydroxylase Tpa1-like proline 4-hydroxylase|tara:strand:- start:2089 stop:2913 length:825 start_codon:yes stop_codon:yes gene_type:complete
MKHVIVENFNLENNKKYFNEFSLNTPFKHFVIDNILDKDAANNILVDFKINNKWTNLSLVNNYRKLLLNDRKLMSVTCNEIIEELGSKEFTEKLTECTGLKNIFLDKELVGGGLQQSLNGGSLNMHTDFTSHITKKNWRRVLNLIIYFNKNWLNTYNGNLEFWDAKVEKKVKSYSPIFNRCVIFKTDEKSFHGFPDTLNLPPNVSRKSFAVYYYILEDKPIKLYPSTFTARPGDKLYYKFLMGVDSFLNKIFSFLKRYKIVNDKFASKILDLFK